MSEQVKRGTGWPALCLAWGLALGLWVACSVEPLEAVVQAAPNSQLSVHALTTERRSNPLGIDQAAPLLGWQLRSPQRAAAQSAYRIQVQAGLGEAWQASQALSWDSKRVASKASLNRAYGGPRLKSGVRYRWRVRVWDKAGQASAWSEVAHWEMGLLAAEDWEADWIGDGRPGPEQRADFYQEDPAPLLRRSFTLAAKPLSARLYVAGPGYWEGTLNGKPLDDSVLNPSWTDYGQLLSYRVFDVGAHLQAGENVLGMMLGNGWYNPLPLEFFAEINFRDHLAVGRPCLRARLVVSLADGEEFVLSTDATWRVSPGPLLRNNIYLGEVYDARREQSGWRRPGFDDSNWSHAKLVPGPKGELRAETLPPIRPQAELPTKRLRETSPGVYVFDMGQNLAGWVRLSMQGLSGTRVSLRYAELLNDDGSLNMTTSMAGWVREQGSGGPGAPARAEQRDEYVMRGGEREAYQTRFSFHGFRYVEVSGLTSAPKPADLVAIPLQTDLAQAGSFTCSDELINGIQQLVDNTFRCNLFSVQSDCPHRERLAYGGDIVVTSQAFMLNYDMGRFYPKTVLDFALTQDQAGGLAQTAPFVGLAQFGLSEGSGPVGWGLALPHLLVENYRYYGELRQIEEHYDAVVKWLAFLGERSKNGVINIGLGDHGNITNRRYIQFVTTLNYARAAKAAARLATLLERPDEAARHRELQASIHAALRALKRFSPKRLGRLGDASQTMQSVGLETQLLQGADYGRGLTLLLERLELDEWKIETGIVGTQAMLEVLASNDETEAAWKLLRRREYPGWGFMLATGATTLWEVWIDDRVKMSRNHPMLGSVSAWFYRHLAGIQIDADANACDRITIRPQVPKALGSAAGSYASARGEIKSSWTQADGVFSLHVQVPVGVEARIGIPARYRQNITESSVPLALAPGLRLLQHDSAEDLRTWCVVGAGQYAFRATAE